MPQHISTDKSIQVLMADTYKNPEANTDSIIILRVAHAWWRLKCFDILSICIYQDVCNCKYKHVNNAFYIYNCSAKSLPKCHTTLESFGLLEAGERILRRHKFDLCIVFRQCLQRARDQLKTDM